MLFDNYHMEAALDIFFVFSGLMVILHFQIRLIQERVYRKIHPILLILILTFLLNPIEECQAQNEGVTQQFWSDFNYSYPFATNYRLRALLGRRSLLSGGEPWSQTAIIPSIEMYPIPAIDLLAGFGNFITDKSVDPNKLELRASIGFRWNIFQQRFILRTLTRLETRHFYYRDTTENDQSRRFRARIELIFPINNKSIRVPKTIYILSDYERFVDFGDEVPGERFANKARFRVGPGWRFNLEWRMELIYTLQRSRDTNSADFQSSDSIYWIRVKYQPHRSKNVADPLEEQ